MKTFPMEGMESESHDFGGEIRIHLAVSRDTFIMANFQ